MVRGIFTTALTALLSENQFAIVQPSSASAKRFDMGPRYSAIDVSMVDRNDKQGVIVEGVADQAESIIEFLRDRLRDLIVREKNALDLSTLMSGERFQIGFGHALYDVMFPGGSKLTLDSFRNNVLPTVDGHHQLKPIDSHEVEVAETRLRGLPEKRSEISRDLMERLVYKRNQVGSIVQIEHVKPNGQIVYLSEAKIAGFEDSTLILKREFPSVGSVYDGLGVSRDKGDYAITEVKENSSKLRHSYFTADGHLKGEFYNVNTAAEFYPGRIRYVDLEVDVVRLPGAKPKIIDTDKLDEDVQKGYVTESLAADAIATAEAIVRSLMALRD